MTNFYKTADGADAGAVLGCDVILLGSPAMDDEVLEDTMEAFYAGIESGLSGKKVGLFGSYDWGDGQWLRDWEDRAKNAGATVTESLMVLLHQKQKTLQNVRNGQFELKFK